MITNEHKDKNLTWHEFPVAKSFQLVFSPKGQGKELEMASLVFKYYHKQRQDIEFIPKKGIVCQLECFTNLKHFLVCCLPTDPSVYPQPDPIIFGLIYEKII